MIVLSGEQALSNNKANPYGVWNAGKSSEVSSNPDHASRRIYDGLARIEPAGPARKLQISAPVFTMGSCFAREIEQALIEVGGNVISMDPARMDRPEFRDGDGNIRTGFFHRFTPRAIWHEFKIAFDELPEWDWDTSLLFPRGNEFVDFNYWLVKGFDFSIDAHKVRRRLAREFVRRVAESELIILTLGFIEAWMHKPSGMYCNFIHPRVLARQPEEFQLLFLDYEDVTFCLNDIYRMLKTHHKTGNFQMVVTVSPVPLQNTFSNQDIVIANEQSKSVLRAAAGTFCAQYADVQYFPSYELARFSDPHVAWRPDRVHVSREMVKYIVETFRSAYFAAPEPVALAGE